MGLTLDGTDIHTTAGIMLDLVKGYAEPAEVRGSDTTIPSAEGRVPRNRVKDRRPIVLEGYVTGTTAGNWRTATDALMALIAFDADPVDLVVTSPYLGESGTSTIAVRAINAMGGEIITTASAGMFQRWSIELESVTPDWA